MTMWDFFDRNPYVVVMGICMLAAVALGVAGTCAGSARRDRMQQELDAGTTP